MFGISKSLVVKVFLSQSGFEQELEENRKLIKVVGGNRRLVSHMSLSACWREVAINKKALGVLKEKLENKNARHTKVSVILLRRLEGELHASLEVKKYSRGGILRLVGVFLELGDTVDEMHAARVIHNDIKKYNVMMSGGRPIIIDFGNARVIPAAMSYHPDSKTGTSKYSCILSLGYFNGNNQLVRFNKFRGKRETDIFSVMITFLELSKFVISV